MNEIKGFFDEYAKFVDDMTSEIGKKDELFMERAAEISRWLDGNFSRMDNAVAGLAGEAGEIGDLWKKLKFHNKELSEENRQKLVDELSDVCWYAMQAAIAFDVDMDEVIRHNVEKLRARHPHGFSPEYMKFKKD